MSNSEILQRFPTEKFKRFWYPTRPLFTIALGLCLASLGIIGILPMAWALWLSATFAFDDLPLTPIMSILTAVNNIAHKRKLLKSMVMLTLVTLAAIAGGVLGFFVLSQVPILMGIITGFIAATSCSPILISVGAIVGGLIAHHTNKISPFMGIALGAFVLSIIPIPVPLMVDFVFICAAGMAFLTGVVAKQSLRLYYKLRYGDTNADGYQSDTTLKEQETFFAERAKTFNVTTDEFRKMTTICKKAIQTIKQKATWTDELAGFRQPISNAYKDIHHGLMTSSTPEEIMSVKKLLKNSMYSNVTHDVDQSQILQIIRLTPTNTLRSDLQVRTLFHQASVYPGIEDEVIAPFTTDLDNRTETSGKTMI